MHEFLNGVAEAYRLDPDLKDTLFVFPNVRSRAYFLQAMAPQEISALTLAQLVERSCQRSLASKERLLFMLYRAYSNVRQAMRQGVEPFDRFRFWGQMILRDFNDIDRYLVDTGQLFRNVEDFKKIQAFYLTEQQEELIRAYWKADPYWKTALDSYKRGDERPFWNHISHEGEPLKKFTQLWAILGDVYNEFHRLLAEKREAYPGLAYRLVAEKIMGGEDLENIRPKRYVFIGFSCLSHSEHAIFRELQKRSMAHFYWDYDPTLMNHRSNSAGQFISTYVEAFPETAPGYVTPDRPHTHTVDIISVASGVTQAQVAAGLLKNRETALVLADAELLVPTVAAIPDSFEQVNVTMGYPLRFSALVQLLSLLTKMQMRVSYDSRGQALFFHKDIAELVKHPAVQQAFPQATAKLLPFMRQNRLFNLTAGDLTEEFDCLRPLLGTVGDDASPRQVAEYICGILDYLRENEMVSGIDTVAFERVRQAVLHFVDSAETFGVSLQRRTFFDLLERTLLETTLPMEGRTFQAMQVMGILETRSLGYPNVVMLSMGDDVYPGTAVGRSFIPEALKRGYGMPTRDMAEADMAYHFYRILSWARTLTLIYDARIGDMRTGQPSRYLTQLTYGNFPGITVATKVVGFQPPTYLGAKATDLSLSKGFLADRLLEYLQGGSKHLSASSLKTYLSCPKQFFLEKVLKLSPPDPLEQESGAADHGQVIHDACQHIYQELQQTRSRIEAEDIDYDRNPAFRQLVERHLTRSINKNLAHACEENLDKPITGGEEALYVEPLRKELVSVFRREVPGFHDIKCEEPFNVCLSVGQYHVNFKVIIDRLDQIEENGKTIYRIIDYKTGRDSITASEVAKVFDGEHNTAAIFQLLLYCEALSQKYGISADCIRPIIYRIKDIDQEEFPLLQIAKQPLENYAQVADGFRELLAEKINELFNPEGLVTVPEVDTNCTFCKIRGTICRY